MRSRIFFVGVTAFWLVMNYLLYRSQWGAHHGFAPSVPLQTVWEKILTAPDSSSLDIYNQEQKIGFGRWGAGTADSPLIGSKVLSADYQPGRPEEKLTGYGLSFEGSLLLGASNRVRFQSNLSLDTNQFWQEFRVHASARPSSWTLLAVAAKQTVALEGDDENGVWNKSWKFADLGDPQTWLGDWVDPGTLGLLGLNRSLLEARSAGMQWEAHEDRMKLGQADLRVYRLDSSILGQHIEMVVSRIGEILWVDLPFHISLRNQAIPFSH